MRYSSRPPAVALAGLVDYIWSLTDVPPHASERVVPTGTLELVINLDANEFRICGANDPDRCERFSGAMVSGAYGRFFAIDTKAHASIVGVHFKPGGAWPILGVPPGALTDRHVDLDSLWGRPLVCELRERLCAAPTSKERFAVLEEVLLSRLAFPRGRHGSIGFAIERLSGAGASVRAVIEEVQLSHRRFLDVFTADVGMKPKLFAMVQRFQRATTRMRSLRSLDWTRLALDCGYFDQSHMIRDFTSLAGASPSALLRSGKHVKVHHAALEDGASDSSNTIALGAPTVESDGTKRSPTPSASPRGAGHHPRDRRLYE